MSIDNYLQDLLNKVIDSESKTVYILKGFASIDIVIKIPKLINEPFSTLLHNPSYKPNLSEMSGAYYLLYEEAALLGGLIDALGFFGYKPIIITCNIFEDLYPTYSSLLNQASPESFYSQQFHPLQNIFSSIEKMSENWYGTFNPLSVTTPVDTINLIDLESFPPIVLKESSEQTSHFPRISSGSVSFAFFVDSLVRSSISTEFVECMKEGLSDSSKRILSFLRKFSTFSVVKSPVSETADRPFTKNKEFIEILRRRNPSYEFRTFKCYKNPSYSNETFDVSQEQIIYTIVENAEKALSNLEFRDIFVTAPTGAGKSMMFQIPAIYLAEKYDQFLTIVISPLIGLMNDQVSNIEDLTSYAATINSDYTPEMRDEVFNNIRQDKTKILYLSPESFIMNSEINSIIGDKKIGLMVIDEAHTVISWGQTFRPNYWYLGERIKQLRKLGGMSFPIATFSATIPIGGTEDVYQEIIDTLGLDTFEAEFFGGVRRDEISFEINRHKSNKDYELEKQTQTVLSINDLIQADYKTIAYFPIISKLQSTFSSIIPNKANMYYGSLPAIAKNRAIFEFKFNIKKTMLATKAFGMGIDVPDIDYVYHYAPTGILVDYIQEIGRAARTPGAIGVAKTDYYEQDFKHMKMLHGISRIRDYQVKGVLRKIHDHYMKHRKRNFTLSPDEFAHVFDKERLNQVESSLISTLLIIDKDFQLGTYGYKPLIFRPKTVFTQGYVVVDDKDMPQLINSKFFRYFELLKQKKELGYKLTENTQVLYVGDLYRVNFKEIWENYFSKLSFSEFKRAFYEGNLEEFPNTDKYIPHYLLVVEWFVDSSTSMLNSLNQYFEVLYQSFDRLAKTNKYFSLSDFKKVVKDISKRNAFEFSKSVNLDNVLSKFYTIMNNFFKTHSGHLKIMSFKSESETYFVEKPTRLRHFFRIF